MPWSFTQYIGDGTTASFAVSFPYLSLDHLNVFVDGTLKQQSDYSVPLPPVIAPNTPTSSFLTFLTPPPQGSLIEIRRQTPLDLLFDFHDASILSEEDLDGIYRHNIFIEQEQDDYQSFGQTATTFIGSFPPLSPGSAGKILVVNQAETGYVLCDPCFDPGSYS